MSADILTSLHGRKIGLDARGRLVVPGGVVQGGEGLSPIVMPGNPAAAAFFDDFTGASQAFSTTPIGGWRSRKGSDGGCVDFTKTDAVGGTVVGTIGATTATMAVSGVQLDRGLDWKANQGNLVLEARLKLSAITTIAIFFGFTDQVAALEMPISSAASADTITTNATDGCGFMFDTAMATDDWWLVGVANDVDATKVDTGLAPVAATYERLRIELDAAGKATFYRNNKRVGTMTLAVTPTVALTPVLAGFNRTTSGTPTITADFVAISGDRA